MGLGPVTMVAVASSGNDCKACPKKGLCPVKAGKSKASLNHSRKRLRTARRQAAGHGPTFMVLDWIRSGIEGTNSRLTRLFGIRLRVRGLPKAGRKARLAVLALNLSRVARLVRQNVQVVR
jgi:hypothetical protein